MIQSSYLEVGREALLNTVRTVAVAVSEDIEVYSEEEAIWALAICFQATTDMIKMPKVFCNRLDPSSIGGMSEILAIDATAPLSWVEEHTSLPDAVVQTAMALLISR